MTPKKEELIELADSMCKDCGWYNDCPLNYKCPPLEALIILIKEAPEEEDD